MGSITGTVKRVGQTTTKGNYQFRELVLNTKEQYPQILSVVFSNDKCIALDKYNEGDHVEVQYNLRGREWTSPQGETKHFNSIQGWRIDGLQQNNSSAAPVPPMETFEQAVDLKSDEPDDLPF